MLNKSHICRIYFYYYFCREEHVQDKALNALVKVLLTVDEHRKRVPMEMLPDLPPFQVFLNEVLLWLENCCFR